MADARYSYNVDLEHPTTSHSLAVLLVSPGSTVLDIGAADGSVARPLVARGCRVWAIEANADVAAKAQSACEAVIVGDVETLDLEAALEGRRFDAVLLLDVLEHLRKPLVTLKHARDLLAPGGRVIVSIPNVTHGAVRVSLMSGAFTYTETGLLDKTHLRFFDRRSVDALFDDAGLRIVERLRVTRGLTETEIPVDQSAVPPEILQMLESDPEATTYQFVLAGVPSGGERLPDSMSLAERLQRRTEELVAQYRQLEAYARSLEDAAREQVELVSRLTRQTTALDEELRSVRTELHAELATSIRDLAQRQVELRHLHADLAVKEAFVADLRQTTERRTADLEHARAGLEDELRGRLRELAQGQLELRHLQKDLAVKEAFIAELRQATDQAQAEAAALRSFTDSAGARIVARIVTGTKRFPALYASLRWVARLVAGRTGSRTS